MNLFEAVQKAVMETEESVAGFCSKFGHNQATIYQKLNPNDKSAFLNLREFTEAIEYSGHDTRILNALGKMFDVTWHQISANGKGPKELFKAYVKEANEAILSAVDHDCLDSLSVKDLDRIEKELLEALEANNQLRAHVTQVKALKALGKAS